CGVQRFILISSDKAVNPVSVMGATKRVAELMLQARAAGARTTFVTVRFGNVLGSNGSVVPLFVEQLKRGGPLTVTHPDVRRYFMLIPEAVQLVLHAAAAGERNSIYVLDMGEPIRLVDLARDLIRLSGFSPEEVPIAFVGLRAGEKLDEELVGHDEVAGPSAVESVMQVRPRRAPHAPTLRSQIDTLQRFAMLGQSRAVLDQLREIVPEFGSPPCEALPAEQPAAAVTVIPAATRVPHRAAATAAAITCSSCGSASVRRSRVNGPLEQLWRQLTDQRPYRCYTCGSRRWMDVIATPPPPIAGTVQPPDLSELDVAFRTAVFGSPSSLMPAMLSGLDSTPSAAPGDSMALDTPRRH
ncbi:MAG: NAD-dependent epimerase/dehydratase family protein, partial [Acidobacteria bacterium]